MTDSKMIPRGPVPEECSKYTTAIAKSIAHLDPHAKIGIAMQLLGFILTETSVNLEKARLNLDAITLSVDAKLPEAFRAKAAVEKEFDTMFAKLKDLLMREVEGELDEEQEVKNV